ncbi:MAG: PAS domain S-box protein [Pirellulaceae bacterium]|nr:PAS domain S-box protein [Pirellulaceae bacterium]
MGKQTEERLRELADAIPQIVWIAAPDGGLTYLNAKATEYTGIGTDQLTGWSWDRAIHPEDLPNTIELWTQTLSDGIPRDIEFRILRVDGLYRWHITRQVPVRDATGNISTWYGTCTDVEDLKRAGEALRESESRFRKLNDFRETVIRTAAEGICVCCAVPEFPFIKFSVWNEQMTELTGYTLEEINDLGWYQTLYPDEETRAAAQKRMARMRLGDDLRAEEWEICRKDGTRRFVAISTSRLEIDDDIPRVVALLHDVTNRRQAERALRRSEERFSKLFYASPFSIIVASYPEGKIIDANHAFLRLFEFQRDEVIGKTTGEINIWANPQDRVAMLERLSNAESARDMEIVFQTKSSSYRTLLMSVEIIRIGGELYSLAMSIDITERKDAELVVQQSLSQLQATLDSTADGILVVDMEGRIVDFNQQFVQVWGLPPNLATQGRKVDLVAAANEHQAMTAMLSKLKDPDAFRQRVGEIYTTPHASSFDVLEFKDGRVVERYSQPQCIDGLPVGRVWSFRDVSEQKHLEEQLRQSQKMEAIGQLAGGIAHDFNNLLTVINGYCELLLENMTPNWKESVQEIREAGRRAGQLTEQLLTFSRQSRFKSRVVSLNDAIARSEKLLRRLIGEQITLTVCLDPNVVAIKADTNQLEQVLMNLAVNARDAMPHGGRLTITTNLVSHGNSKSDQSEPASAPYAQLQITDSGLGISKEHLPRIFEPFFTTKAVGKGSGLGLSVVHGIMQQHNGIIRVTSQPDEGTTFTLLFPHVAAAPAQPTFVTAPSVPQGTETILLVEDEQGVRTMARRMLELYGYRVLEAPNGQEALQLIKCFHEPIHLLVTDVVMPEIGGRQLAETMRVNCPDLRVIYISGYHTDASIYASALSTSESLLKKPFSTQQLVMAVRQQIDAVYESDSDQT